MQIAPLRLRIEGVERVVETLPQDAGRVFRREPHGEIVLRDVGARHDHHRAAVGIADEGQIVARVIVESGGKGIAEAVQSYLLGRVDPYQRLARLMETPAEEPLDARSVVMVMIHHIRQVVA